MEHAYVEWEKKMWVGRLTRNCNWIIIIIVSKIKDEAGRKKLRHCSWNKLSETLKKSYIIGKNKRTTSNRENEKRH